MTAIAESTDNHNKTSDNSIIKLICIVIHTKRLDKYHFLI